MHFFLALLSGLTLAATNAAAATTLLNFLTWPCANCQDSNTCHQVNYQADAAGQCIELRQAALSVKLFSKQDCPRGQLQLFNLPGCTDPAPLTYTLETPLPSPGNPTCHNETALAAKRYYKVVC